MNLIGDFSGGQACGGAGAEGFAREHMDMQGFTRESYNSGGARATPIPPHSRRHAPTAALEQGSGWVRTLRGRLVCTMRLLVDFRCGGQACAQLHGEAGSGATLCSSLVAGTSTTGRPSAAVRGLVRGDVDGILVNHQRLGGSWRERFSTDLGLVCR